MTAYLYCQEHYFWDEFWVKSCGIGGAMSGSKIGQRIRRARENRNLGALDFCANLSIPVARLYHIEEGLDAPTEREIMELIIKHEIVGDELFEAAEQQDDKVARFLDHADLLQSLYKAVKIASSFRSSEFADRVGLRKQVPPTADLTRSDFRHRDLSCELGMVSICETKTAVSLSWDVDRVNFKSIAAAVDYLSDLAEATPVRLSYHKAGRMDEEMAGPAAAVGRIEEIQQYANIDLMHGTVIRRMELSDLAESKPLLRCAWDVWTQDRTISSLLDHSLTPYGLFFNGESESTLEFTHLGERSVFARFLGSAFKSVVGQRCNETLTDESYDNRVSAMYFESLSCGKPIYDHVLAQIDVGSRRVWRPYQRLLLPDGHRLACFVEATADLSIDFLGRQPV